MLSYSGKSPLRERLSLLEGVPVSEIIQQRSLIEVIDLKELDLALKQELIKRGIQNPYHYGIWSKELEDFVIMDGNYIVMDGASQQFSASPLNRSLKASPYKVDLFTSVLERVPGTLFLDFPNRKRYLSRDLTTPLILSIFFSSIVLLCFCIYRQRNFPSKKAVRD